MFQLLGYSAFLIPMAALWLGIKWFRSRPVESQKATLFGYGLLLLFLPSLFTLIHFPDVRGAIPAGGMVGALLAGALTAGLYNAGGVVVGVGRLCSGGLFWSPFLFARA